MTVVKMKNQFPFTAQSEAAECGLACLAMIANALGHDIDLRSLRRRFPVPLTGLTLTRIIDIADELQLAARPLKANIEYLSHARLPCILHWDFNHFVVLTKEKRNKYVIYDPASGRRVIDKKELGERYTGVLLELETTSRFTPLKQNKKAPSVITLLRKTTGLVRALCTTFGLALGVELLGLLLPYQTQLMLDKVVPSSDVTLLVWASLIFGIALAVQTSISAIRSWITSWLSATVSAQWITELFSRLLSLPLSFFEKRQVGDILSRFTSVTSIQASVTGSLIDITLGGLFGIAALIVLGAYSTAALVVVLAISSVYTLTRYLSYSYQRRLNEETLIYTARQQSELIESVRGIQAILLAGKQPYRRARFLNAVTEATRRTCFVQRTGAFFHLASQTLFGYQKIILIASGAYLAIEGKTTLGAITAIVAYADQFATKYGALVDKLVELRLLAVHLERISDITESEAAPNETTTYSGDQPAPSITCRNLGFRFSPDSPWLFRNLNLKIDAGESVAITGPSGCGKTTLLKLILGLLEPTEGSIEVGGIDIRQLGLRNYRSMIGAVMQDDLLFTGTIADNVAFGADQARFDDVIRATQLAGIHSDVRSMPMGYETQVGDMGSTLSGGQRQRLILARALYRKPSILVLDEATSHLDLGNEGAINERISGMNITRVIVAHRASTIASAQRIVELHACAANVCAAGLTEAIACHP